jgi:hypothetical protein
MMIRLTGWWALLAGVAYGGQVYGTLRDATGKPLAGAAITITSSAKTTYEAKSGADGRYQVFVKENGRCEVRLKTGEATHVFSYDEPAKYDLDVAAGKLKAK